MKKIKFLIFMFIVFVVNFSVFAGEVDSKINQTAGKGYSIAWALLPIGATFAAVQYFFGKDANKKVELIIYGIITLVVCGMVGSVFK